MILVIIRMTSKVSSRRFIGSWIRSMMGLKVKTKLFDDNILRGVVISVDTCGGYVIMRGAKGEQGKTAGNTIVVVPVPAPQR